MSVWQQVLHQDVLDILPCDVHLHPCGVASQSELMLLELARSENGLSKLWSASAVRAKQLRRQSYPPLVAVSGPNHLAEQCSYFCGMLSREQYGDENVYVVAALCHQVRIPWSCSRSNVAFYALVTKEACGLQLVWNSSADRDLKVKICVQLLSWMFVTSLRLLPEVSCSG